MRDRRSSGSSAASDPRAEEQANVPGRLSDLPLLFWAMAVLTGVGAGLGAILMMAVLRFVQHLALNYHSGEYSKAAATHGSLRLVVVLAVGGMVTGVGLWLLHRSSKGTGGEPTEVVWTHHGSISVVRTLLSGALSEVTVAMGGSIGREAAPQRAGAAAGALLGRHSRLTPEQRTLLIACGAGAGLAAVYNVPLAGALFTMEIYLGSLTLTMVVPALLTSGIATAVSWLTLPQHAVYSIPALAGPNLAIMVFALVIGPLAGLASAGYIYLIGWASDHRPRGRLLLLEPLLVFTALGLIALSYPLLLGNGVDLAQYAFTGGAGILTLLALTALKPIVTAACLRSGATGGLFTPTLSFGAAFGALAGHIFLVLWPGPMSATYSLLGAVALLAAAIEAPLTGIAMLIELTHTVTLVAPMVLAAVSATLVSRRFNLRSIYSARLPPP
jgi:H+/Cl- antiporter ClcA